ncbi:RDD family protein [Candidatus Woesearchaeota archaeon]|nr:RDD family protein [Candidatus Woesearchaeota archaeon]
MASLDLPGMRTTYTEATTWKRVVAFVLDLLVIDLLLTPFDELLRSIDSAALMRGAALPESLVAAGILMGVVALLYFGLFEYLLGGTIGMRLFNLSVKGRRTLGRCLLRNIYAIPIFPLTLLWIVEPVYLFWRKERLLERWSGTSTVERVTV